MNVEEEKFKFFPLQHGGVEVEVAQNGKSIKVHQNYFSTGLG